MKNSPFLKLIQCVVLCLLAFTIIPECLYADEDTALAYKVDKDGNITYYDYIPDAMDGSREDGAVIHMLKDWDIGDQINIVEGTKSTIYMDGHTIKKTNGKQSDDCEGGIFTIHPNAELFLYGSTENTELTDSKGNIVNSGGLVTGGYAFYGGAIYMKKDARLHLTNVALSGNKSEYKGGAIFITNENCYIWMDNAHIDHNWSGSSGGAIYSDGDGTHIYMDNHSTINYNQANDTGSDGGGVAFNYSWFSIEGDGTAEVSYNKIIPGEYGAGCNGGGIYAAEKKVATNSGIISGLTIEGNEAGYGGGVDINPRNTVLKDVRITNNVARIEGGGIYVLYDVDITLKGKVVVNNNKRGDSNSTNYDDISLGTCLGTEAYILLDNLDADSLIGIRTGTVGEDRLVVKNISDTNLAPCFFMNLNSSYHVGYQASNNELWQRTGSTKYIVKANNKDVGEYGEGTKNVTVVDDNTDANKIFVSWTKSANIIKDVSNKQWTSKTITFTMPSKNVSLMGEYKAAANNLSLNIDNFAQDNVLPGTATFNWTFDGKNNSEEVDLKWYKKQDGLFVSCDGEIATYGKDYVFETCAKAIQDGVTVSYGTVDGIHVLSSAVSLSDITVNCAGVKLAELSLNDEGALTLKSDEIIVGEDVIKYIDPIVVSVREGSNKTVVASAINNAYETTATSNNDKRYAVKAANSFDIGDLDNDWFDSQGNIVIPTASNNKKPSYYIYEGSKTVTSYDANIDLNNNTVKLIVVVLSDNGGVDTTPSIPELQEGKAETQNGVLYQQIITNYNNVTTPNTKVFLLYNKNGDNNWTIKNMFYTNDAMAKEGEYKILDAIAWVIDENNNMSKASEPKTYILNNKNESLTLSNSKINVKIQNVVYGQSLPQTVEDINLTSYGTKTSLYQGTKISWNTANSNVEYNKTYQAKIELSNVDGFDINYLSSLPIVVNDDSNIKAYIEKENDKVILKIIFPELKDNRETNSSYSQTCEESMKSKDWIWSETKKACVYKVSNTNSK